MELRFVKNLKNLLHGKGLNASTLSRRTGVPVTTLSNWLAGYQPKNVKQIKVVADYFEISVDELLFGNGKVVLEESSVIKQYEDEIHAGIYEVTLRRVRGG